MTDVSVRRLPSDLVGLDESPVLSVHLAIDGGTSGSVTLLRRFLLEQIQKGDAAGTLANPTFGPDQSVASVIRRYIVGTNRPRS